MQEARVILHRIAAALLFALLTLGPVVARAQKAEDDIAATEYRFVYGLALVNAGQPRPAAAVFTAILARDPDAIRVRLELARAYFLSRQWGRARREFLSVLSGDIPDPVRANVLRFLREIDARRGFEWDADVAFVTLGDTRDYDTDTVPVSMGGNSLPFTINERDGRTSPGLRFSVSGGYRRIIPAGSSETVRTLGFGRLVVSGDEAPGSRFDDLTLLGEAGSQLIWSRSTLTVAPRISRRFLTGDHFEDRVGLRSTFRHRTERGTVYALSGTWSRIDHHRSVVRDGNVISATVSVSHPLSPRVSLGGRLFVEDRDATSPIDNYRLSRLTASGVFDTGHGITLSPGLYVEHRKAQASGPLSADHTGAGAALTIESGRIILGSGFTPYMRLSAARVKSDIRALSYTETGLALGLERRF